MLIFLTDQVKQENARIRLMYDLDRTAASREAAVLQEQLRQVAKQRDEALRKVDVEKKKAEKLAHMASIFTKLPKVNNNLPKISIIYPT